MLNYTQLTELIIKPTLIDLVEFSENALTLMVFTCAVESQGGYYLKQIKGPALGIYQMEPETYNDIWQNYIKHNGSLLMRLLSNFEVNFMPNEDRLIYDLRYATAMTRIHYLRVSCAIPDKKDLHAIYSYYKQHYNSSLGAAQEDKAIQSYLSFVNS